MFYGDFLRNYSGLGAFAKLRKAIISFVMSVCPSVRPSAWNNSAPTGRNLIKLEMVVHRRQYGACALHAGYLRLQTHTQNM